MKILVTGGAGFIGSNLALALCRAFPDAGIVCMDNLYRRGSELNLPRLKAQGIQFHWGDIREPAAFPAGPFDILVECSAEPSVLAGQNGSAEYLFHTNLSGAFNCLEKARSWGSQFLFLSTSRVYPISSLEAHPWTEEATRFAWSDKGLAGISSQGVKEVLEMSGSRSLYGFTKYAAELLIEEYRAAYGLRAAINRCGVIAGPWQFGKVDQGVAAFWVLAHHFRRPLAYIGYGGQGKQVRDFLHVEDLCELIVEQLSNFEHWDGWRGNVAGGFSNSASLCELTDICSRITGNKAPITSIADNRTNDLRIFIGDCRQLYTLTNWRPQRSVFQIIADISNWVATHENLLGTL